jgi:hypothetical protein
MKRNTDHRQSKLPAVALEILRDEPGSFMRVARRLKKSRSHISKVAAGHRRSLRVSHALIAEARRIAIRRGYELALEIEEHAQR